MSKSQAEPPPTGGTIAAPDHAAARRQAYELLIDAQVVDRDVAERAEDLLRQARDARWYDVRALVDYALAFRSLVDNTPPGAATRLHDEFVGWARRAGDPLATALALRARVDAPDRSATDPAGQIDDLVHAYEAAERIRTTVDRAFALHEIAGAFHQLRLWELTTEIYDEVERLSSGLRSPRALIGSFAFNRFYTLACELLHAREAGSMAEVHRRADRVDALRAEPRNPAIPPEWHKGVDDYAAICHVLAEDADADLLVARLDAKPGEAVDEQEVRALLQCVLAWHHMRHGRPAQAEPLILEGGQVLAETADAAFRSFALWLLARVHNRGMDDTGRDAMRRYHRGLLRARDDARAALVTSVRARLQTGRLRAERDRFAHESLTDPLTLLANRRALERRLQAVTPSTTLIMVDIDQFKPVNDGFGHDVGDEVLRRIGRILLDCVRPGDLAARLGGDEFMLVLDAADREVAVRRGYEVRDRIATEAWHELHASLEVAASVGVAWGARDGVTLYREVDEGLYRAKRAGGARVRSAATGDQAPGRGDGRPDPP
ncbi:MAG: GGDEF domain-containing protein [Actinobacteria bacterium]|nr:GGDEF domain-containing protein [Actinomycetota bacterium]